MHIACICSGMASVAAEAELPLEWTLMLELKHILLELMLSVEKLLDQDLPRPATSLATLVGVGGIFLVAHAFNGDANSHEALAGVVEASAA